jgi:ribosomal-protein-alanine N-acetyltransferase
MPKPKRFPTTIPQLSTNRLLLRSLTLDDVPAIFHHFSDPQVVAFLMDPLESLEDAKEVIQQLRELFKAGKGMYWAVTLKVTGELVGICGFEKFGPGNQSEIGFDLAHAWWRKGLMSEALTAVIQYGFEELGLKSIIAITAPDNRRALRLLTKLRFRYAGQKQDKLKLRLTHKVWGEITDRKSEIRE